MDKFGELIKDFGGAVLITSDENCFYYSGFTGGDSFLLITQSSKYLFTDKRFTQQSKNEAPDFTVFDCNVMNALRDVAKSENIKQFGFEENRLSVSSFCNFSSIAKMVPMGSRIDGVRKIKTPLELDKIEEAQRLSEDAFLYLLKNIKAGMTEIEAAFILESYMRKNGAKGTSFDTVVASGARGAMPHGIASKAIIEKGDLVVIDFGCKLDGYCSDMTRTIGIGSVSEEKKKIYNIVLKANLAACEAARPDMTGGELDKVARDIIDDAGYGECFGHSLGHGVGIEIHESPTARSGDDEPFCEGMTVTIEPGIYIPDLCGVRIEDLVAFTGNGIKNFNKVTKELVII
ncbi:MAG: aminopeptidase P family protein [Bacillota bacterium]|nr:aminopeptidase P family protein [Bacillota bacterium]